MRHRRSLFLIAFVGLVSLAGCSNIVPNGYITDEQVSIIKNAVKNDADAVARADEEEIEIQATRCVGRINGILSRIKTIRSARAALSIAGGTISLASGITALALPDGSRDAKIATATLSTIAGVAVLVGGVLGNVDTDSKILVGGQAAFNEAQEKANQLAKQSKKDEAMVRDLKKLLRKCGDVSGYSNDAKDALAAAEAEEGMKKENQKILRDTEEYLAKMKEHKNSLAKDCTDITRGNCDVALKDYTKRTTIDMDEFRKKGEALSQNHPDQIATVILGSKILADISIINGIESEIRNILHGIEMKCTPSAGQAVPPSCSLLMPLVTPLLH